MQNDRNIYQAARETKGLTQETAAERLSLSVESLGAYEQDRRRPPDSTVLRMAQVYDSPYLCYKHLQTGAIGCILPSVQRKPLEQATLRIVRLLGQLVRDDRVAQLMEIAEDGVITAAERPLHDEIMTELQQIASSYFEIEYAGDGHTQCAERARRDVNDALRM